MSLGNPLGNSKIDSYAELAVIMLRPEPSDRFQSLAETLQAIRNRYKGDCYYCALNSTGMKVNAQSYCMSCDRHLHRVI